MIDKRYFFIYLCPVNVEASSFTKQQTLKINIIYIIKTKTLIFTDEKNLFRGYCYSKFYPLLCTHNS